METQKHEIEGVQNMSGLNATQLIDRVEGYDISSSAVEVVKTIKLLSKTNQIDSGQLFTSSTGDYVVRFIVRTRSGEAFTVSFDLQTMVET